MEKRSMSGVGKSTREIHKGETAPSTQDLLQASASGSLRTASTLRSFGHNYLSHAINQQLSLLAVPDGPEIHLYHYCPDRPPRPMRCVLRPPPTPLDRRGEGTFLGGSGKGIDRDHMNALHVSWCPDAAVPSNLLAVTWPSTLVIYHIELKAPSSASFATSTDGEEGPHLEEASISDEVQAKVLTQVKLGSKPMGMV